MSDIQTDLSAILADFAKQSTSGNPYEASVAAEVKVEVPSPEVPVAAPTVEAPVTTAQVEQPKVEEKKVESNEETFSDWDSAPTTPVAPAAQAAPTIPVEVFSELGKALGLDKVEGKEDVVRAISALKAEADKAKGPDKTQVRPELLKAIELDQKGGDFYEYLKVTSADFSKADPVQLYEDYVIDRFADANGNVDEDKVNNYLDSIPVEEKEFRGRELQERLVADQRAKIAAIENDAIQRKQKADTELKSALSGLTEIDGFKVTEDHKRAVFEWVTGKMMKDLFYGPDGNLDPQKVARVGFRNLFHEKLDSFYKSKIRNATKREILADVTNAQVTSPAIPTQAATVKNGYDISDYVKDLEQKMYNK